MKQCGRCGANYQPFGQRSLLCKPCKRAYDREYHASRSQESKARKQALQVRRLQENRQMVFDYLKTHACITCGEDDPVVLEFDHIDPAEKEYTVSNMLTLSKKKIMAEIAKCRVLCANCHRRRTAVQFGWYEDLNSG